MAERGRRGGAGVTRRAGAAPAAGAAAEVLGPPLLALFRHLLERGARLGVRDYLDALRALEAGYGNGERAALRRLVETLWTRSDEERRIVARWFDAMLPAPPALLEPLEQQVRAGLPRRSGLQGRVPGSGPRGWQASEPGSAPADEPASGVLDPGAGTAPGGARARVAIGGVQQSGGLPLPHLLAEPAIADDYVLQAQPPISERQFAVLWRRCRRASRSGPKRELDVEATLRERCRRGVLVRPVMRARRRNGTRLLVLADASPSMAPWRAQLEALDASLAFGRLGASALRWFGNVPRREVHADAQLASPEARDALLERVAGGALLVVSDAGSARGTLNRRRAAQTAEFLGRAAAACRSVVWLNPMPPERWAGSTAELIAADPRLTMLPLDAANLLRAVDILRGHK